jgi:hypothetical protein
MWSDLMDTSRNLLKAQCKAAALTVAWVMMFSASAAVAQQPPQEDAAPAAATPPPADKPPVLSGKGPLRLPAPAAPEKPALPVARPFAPSEQVRADADVAFPADI